MYNGGLTFGFDLWPPLHIGQKSKLMHVLYSKFSYCGEISDPEICKPFINETKVSNTIIRGIMDEGDFVTHLF